MQRSDWEADIAAAQKAEQAGFERSLADRKVRIEEEKRMSEVNQKLQDNCRR